MRKNTEAIDKYFNQRRKIVGVLGSGSTKFEDLAKPLGRMIAEEGYHLLTGAGGGTMRAVSKAFSKIRDRKGVVIGIVRADGGREKQDFAPKKPPNKYVEIPIFTHLTKSDTSNNSRNHINILSSDVVVVLPGAKGTLSEVNLASEYGWPIIFFLNDNSVAGESIGDLTVRYDGADDVFFANNVDEIRKLLRELLGDA